MKLKLLYFIGFIGLCSLNLNAQQNQTNLWLQYLGRAQLAESWRATSVWQYRSYNLVTDSRLFLINNYVDYKLKNAEVQFGGGYMYLDIMPYNEFGEKRSIIEHRSLQQVTIGNKVSRRFSISHRFRLEQRFLFTDWFIMRARYLFSSRFKLGDLDNTKWSLIFKNEIRMNLDKERAFDSNRISAGVSYQLSKSISIQPGIIAQLEAAPIPNDYYFALKLRQKFNFRKNNTKPDIDPIGYSND